MRRIARLITSISLMLAAIAAVLIASGSGVARSWSPVAYQGAPGTSTTVSNAPSFPYGSCVPVRITVTSDAGVPEGTVEFAVDGVVYDRRVVPRSGRVTEMIGCCGSRFSKPLPAGTHHFTATFIPKGNWAPSHGTGQVVIVPVKGGKAPVCGGTSTHGLPSGVDAGLDSTGTTSGSNDQLLRAGVSGSAVVAASLVVALYRRRGQINLRRRPTSRTHPEAGQ
ncbi:Ig-like domain-containing protein [Nocardioides baekrokdamisoli]|uniref:Ig-like domain-containing protein n=1 Tax=Nocardioides baekrokdamisoli TaxID=1804624 RepID=UPI0013DD975B|nr:Ig-like domain-containing protein [Nocardioides baekrokdamisoli]